MEMGNFIFGNSRGKYPFERGKWQEEFCDFFRECGFDAYGHINEDDLEKYLITIDSGRLIKTASGEEMPEHTHAFDNGVFRVMPYWWGESREIAAMPNFIFYPPDGSEPFELQWYKYPLRDAYSNREITFSEFLSMLHTCKESISDILRKR